MNAPARRTILADRARLEWYLARLEVALQDYPGRRRRQILKELRAEALAAAPEAGMRAALEDLGPTRLLAARYLAELERPGPRWNDGAVVAVFTAFALPLYFWVGASLGAVETLGTTGGGRSDVTLFGVTMHLVNTADEISVAWQLHWGWVLACTLVGVVVFLLAARAWRALGR